MYIDIQYVSVVFRGVYVTLIALFDIYIYITAKDLHLHLWWMKDLVITFPLIRRLVWDFSSSCCDGDWFQKGIVFKLWMDLVRNTWVRANMERGHRENENKMKETVSPATWKLHVWKQWYILQVWQIVPMKQQKKIKTTYQQVSNQRTVGNFFIVNCNNSVFNRNSWNFKRCFVKNQEWLGEQYRSDQWRVQVLYLGRLKVGGLKDGSPPGWSWTAGEPPEND